MIKKFTTFLASMVALLALSFNAVAQTSPVVDLEKGTNEGLYLLYYDFGGADEAQVGVAEDGRLVLSTNSSTSAGLEAPDYYWCVTVETQDASYAAAYKFLNKGTGVDLSATMGDFNGDYTLNPEVILGGEISTWDFSRNYQPVAPNKALVAYYEDNSVVYIIEENGVLKLAAAPGRDLDYGQSLGAKFTLVEIDKIVLTENQFNTVLGTQDEEANGKKVGVDLTFTPDVKGAGNVNYFNENRIYAEYAETVAGEEYHFVRRITDGKYLTVANEYTNQTGVNRYLKYNWKEVPSGTAPSTVLGDSAKFKFTYYPSADQLYIQVKTVWFDLDIDANLFNVTSNDRYISLQKLDEDETLAILTVSARPVNYNTTADPKEQQTTISLGFANCKPSGNRTTIKDGLYFIKNAKGQYLASPIYNNGQTAEWVTLKTTDQNPAHMPAYQWVVLQNSTVNEVSPIAIYNREFENLNSTNVYVSKNGDYVVTSSANTLFATGEKVEFVDIRTVDESAFNNSSLGYAHFADDSLLVTRYLFNYLHTYATDKFMSYNKEEKALVALEGESAFKLTRTNRNAFGFDTDRALNADGKARIPGLSRLYRSTYVIDLNNTTINGTYAKNDEDIYTINGSATAIPVFLKENNHVNGKHYYSIVEAYYATANSIPVIDNNAKKAGVSDTDFSDVYVRVQDLSETRTSAFAVIPDDRPLYRRFNGVGGGVRNEAPTDRRDTLEFQEYYRGEVLGIESNPKFTQYKGVADILGIDYREAFLSDDRNPKAKFGFVVDTAWVKRGRGVVKPQYLISIERNDFLGSDEELCPIDPSPEHQAVCHHYRPSVPAFNRGKYLINYSGIAAELGEHYSDIYRWNDRFNRAGFVHAIHRGDSLYILLADKYNFYDPKVTNETINFATIVEEGKASYAKATDRPVVIVDLKGDEHKFVTWSMRYFDPENWSDDPRFLIESLKLSDAEARRANLSTQPDIAPTYAEWLKSNNGVLVLSVPTESTFDEMITNGDDALIFDVNNAAEAGVATNNDKELTATEVKVIAAEGKVTVLNAAGKKVVVSNVLGQTVANTVLSSDNASIAAPKGIVVVAVEGEEPVKAIVK